MDNFDLRILDLLARDGRISWTRMAEHVNLSASACQRRVEALIDDGIIDRFTIRLNDRAIGNEVKAFVAVNVERSDTALAHNFQSAIATHPMVQSCHMISGSIDFMLEVAARNLADFARFIDEELLVMPAVRDATSSIVLKVIKANEPVIRGG